MRALKSLKLSATLPAAIVGLSLATAVVTAQLGYNSAKQGLTEAAREKLLSLVEGRATSLQDWMEGIEGDLTVLASNPSVINAIYEFDTAWTQIEGDPKRELQAAYIDDNPYPVGEKEQLARAEGDSLYNLIHADYHPYFRSVQASRGYYDIFLFNASGDLIYSVFKERDYATNLVDGAYATSGLGTAFAAARDGQSGVTNFVDFAPYAPSSNAPASFISSPVYDREGALAGVIAFQMPIDSMNNVLGQRVGLGETGHTYAVGADLLMRNDSPLSEESTTLTTRVENDVVNRALAGEHLVEEGEGVFSDDVFSAAVPLEMGDMSWALVAEQDASEVYAPVIALRQKMWMQIGLFAVLLSIAGFFLARTVARPLARIVRAMNEIREGNYAVDVPCRNRGDEIGIMSGALEEMREGLAEGDEINKQALFKSVAFDTSPVPMVMMDTNCVIRFANNALDTFYREHEEHLKIVWPTLDPDNVVGRDISRPFDDAGSRPLLAQKDLLPLVTEKVGGDKRFTLTILGVFDEDGTHKGNILQYADVTDQQRNAGIIAAVDRSEAMADFDLDGRVISVNEKFLEILGYDAREVVGQNHKKFLRPEDANAPSYADHWARLCEGENISGKFRRISKAGEEVWLDASYNVVIDSKGEAVRVVMIGADVTALEKERRRAAHTAAHNAGILAAVNATSAMIEFDLGGNVVNANENFLAAMQYPTSEIVGQHHSMFVVPEDRNRAEYQSHWDRLRAGESISGKFRRVNKIGQEVWLDATYSPVIGEDGKPERFFKIATDITESENTRLRLAEERAVREQEQTLVVTSLENALASLAAGRLDCAIDQPFAGEYDQVRVNFNETITALAEVVGTLTDKSNSMRHGVTEIAQAADDLSRRTESQAASLEETAAALDQATTSVNETATAASDANSLVSQTAKEAEASGETVRQAVGAMSAIERSSGEISQIISVIDEIAFQTNLLALNAGVEAARAGDAGRGFAVVASEVRALAQRSSDAAKEIKTLIQASTEHVGSGVELVGKAGSVLERINSSVAEVSTLVATIASSAQEQSRGLQEINSAVNQMDQVTQQNAAMVEETTAASHSLNDEANELLRVVGHFSLGGKTSHGAPVVEQQRRVETFAAAVGNTAVKIDDDADWDEF